MIFGTAFSTGRDKPRPLLLILFILHPEIVNRFPARKKIRLPAAVYDQGRSFFITISTHHKYPWFTRYPSLCLESVQLIKELPSLHKLKVFAWCIMPDHLHLIIQGVNIIKVIRLLKGKLTPIARSYEAGRKLWQRSFFDHAIRKEDSLRNIACYLWENPIRAKIIAEPTRYRWSGSEVWPDWREIYNKG